MARMTKEFKLRAYWKRNDLMLDYPLGINTNRDASYLSSIFNDSFLKEMESRGYDIKKIKFEIPIKEDARVDKFSTLNQLLKNNNR